MISDLPSIGNMYKLDDCLYIRSMNLGLSSCPMLRSFVGMARDAGGSNLGRPNALMLGAESDDKLLTTLVPFRKPLASRPVRGWLLSLVVYK